MRVLHMPPDTLSSGCALPLDSVVVEAPPFISGELQLRERLGCGGSSDVYVCTPQPGSQEVVLKLPRAATEAARRTYEAEKIALGKMAGSPPGTVPRLLGVGVRTLSLRQEPLLASAHAVPWPVLLLSPRGTPLSVELARRLADVAPEEALAARRAFADAVVSGVLRGLCAAHDARIVHCDVRPSNVVFLAEPLPSGAGLLVDYGLSRPNGRDCAGCGVRNYAADVVFSTDSCPAAPELDLVAVAYTWLSCVYGDAACRAPWHVLDQSPSTWLQDAAPHHGDVAELGRHVSVLAARRRGALTAYYQWPWPQAPDGTAGR